VSDYQYVFKFLQQVSNVVTNILRNTGNFLFLPKNIFGGPPKGGQSTKCEISKFLELYDMGTLNLCLKMPGTMSKESAQSDHPVLRKRQKRA
jgi:hypothetical protein